MNDVAEQQDKITLAEAFRRYNVPIATLRYWLDKGELTRDYRKGRVVVSVDELEKKLKKGEKEQ